MQGYKQLWRVLVVSAVCLLGMTVAPASGQSVTGSIVGKVADASAGVLPGSLVTITSPSLIQGSETATTDGDGGYRFQNLPVGVYVVAAELSGFDTAKREAIVEAG
jgi:hypothetical protein